MSNVLLAALAETCRTMTISLSYSTLILFLSDFLIITTYPDIKSNTFNSLRYMLYFMFGLISYKKYFPIIRWVILQEEFRNYMFDWKISGPSIIIIGCCYSSLMIFPSEFVFLLLTNNAIFEDTAIRLLCGAPATIISMAIFETLFFHRYFRGIFLNML
jgi:hypothetical protein